MFLSNLNEDEPEKTQPRSNSALFAHAFRQEDAVDCVYDTILAEKLMAYPAVIANLPGGERRSADYHAFIDLDRRLEADTHNASSVWRDIRDLIAREANVARTPVAARNAVTLSNAQKAKLYQKVNVVFVYAKL